MKYEDYKELGSEAAVKVCPVRHTCISHIYEVGVVGTLYTVICSDPGMPLARLPLCCRQEMSGRQGTEWALCVF